MDALPDQPRTDFHALRAEQEGIAARAVMDGTLEGVRSFAALDVSTQRGAPLFAAAVLIEDGEITATATAMLEPAIPYVPGFLSFREAPVLELALAELPHRPQLLWVDGHGLTHPRRAGIATYLGVRAGLPSLGIAKKLLAGTLDDLPLVVGARAGIRLNNELRGFAWRTKVRALPVFVSAGHLCTPEAALGFVERFLDGYRLPWPTRAAHDASNVARRAWLAATTA